MNSGSDTDDPDVVSDVVTRVSDSLDVEPMELEPLATAVDPDLVTRFASSGAVADDSEMRFRYSGCDVRVTGSGAVSVDRESTPDEPTADEAISDEAE